jgi:hypothetical protein
MRDDGSSAFEFMARLTRGDIAQVEDSYICLLLLHSCLTNPILQRHNRQAHGSSTHDTDPATMEYQQEYVEQLRSVLQFLQDNGFAKAADAVYEQLNDKEGTEGEDSKDQQRQDSAAGPSEEYEEQYHATSTSEPQQYRSRSAEPVLTRCGPPSSGGRSSALCMACRHL